MTKHTIDFVDEDKSQAKIVVLGVGGGGGNAVSSMVGATVDGQVSIHAINTDAQALDGISDECGKIQIYCDDARGLGAGADPEKAKKAALQSLDRVEEIVEGMDMVFIAAGMGGGTGTGASPVIAQKCRELGILTVAVVTRPFYWENRDKAAAAGIENLSGNVDSIIIIPNDRIREVCEPDVTLAEGYAKCDEVLANAVSGICDVIYRPGKINVDFADVKTVMSETGQAMMGFAVEEGVDRASRAVDSVINCPLLEGVSLKNARGLLVNITSNPRNFGISEQEEIMRLIREPASSTAKIIPGLVDDEEMGDKIRITLIATGLRNDSLRVSESAGAPPVMAGASASKLMGSNRLRRNAAMSSNQGNLLDEDDRERPTVLRRQLS